MGIKISGLPLLEVPDDADTVLVVSGGVTRRSPVGAVRSGITAHELTPPITPVPTDGGVSPAGNTPAGSLELLFTSTLDGEPEAYAAPYWLYLRNPDESGLSEHVLVIGRPESGTRTLAAPTRFTHTAGDSARYHYAGPAVAAGPGSVPAEVFAQAAVRPWSPAFTEAYQAKLEAIPADADATDIDAIAAALAANITHPNLSFNGAKLTSIDGPSDPQDAANKTYVDDQDAATLGAAQSYTDAAVAAPAPVEITTDTLTLDASHNGKTLYCTHGDGCAITVPTTTLPSNFVCQIVRMAAGVNLSGSGAGNLVVNADFGYELAGLYSPATVQVLTADTVLLSGDLAPT